MPLMYTAGRIKTRVISLDQINGPAQARGFCVAWSRWLCGSRFNLARQFAEDKFLQFHLVGGIVDVNTNKLAVGVIVEHDTLRDLDALAARLLGQIDI